MYDSMAAVRVRRAMLYLAPALRIASAKASRSSLPGRGSSASGEFASGPEVDEAGSSGSSSGDSRGVRGRVGRAAGSGDGAEADPDPDGGGMGADDCGGGGPVACGGGAACEDAVVEASSASPGACGGGTGAEGGLAVLPAGGACWGTASGPGLSGGTGVEGGGGRNCTINWLAHAGHARGGGSPSRNVPQAPHRQRGMALLLL